MFSENFVAGPADLAASGRNVRGRQTLGHVEWQAQHEAGLRLRGDFEVTATPVSSR
jgi:hypothetical protein